MTGLEIGRCELAMNARNAISCAMRKWKGDVVVERPELDLGRTTVGVCLRSFGRFGAFAPWPRLTRSALRRPSAGFPW